MQVDNDDETMNILRQIRAQKQNLTFCLVPLGNIMLYTRSINALARFYHKPLSSLLPLLIHEHGFDAIKTCMKRSSLLEYMKLDDIGKQLEKYNVMKNDNEDEKEKTNSKWVKKDKTNINNNKNLSKKEKRQQKKALEEAEEKKKEVIQEKDISLESVGLSHLNDGQATAVKQGVLNRITLIQGNLQTYL